MPHDVFSTVLRRLLPVAALLCAVPALAQRPFADSARAARAAAAVTGFIRATGDEGITGDNLFDFTIDRFREKMTPLMGKKPFAEHLPYTVTGVQSVRTGDSVGIVSVTTIPDTLPRIGPVAIDMTFFVVLDSSGWKISDMRRFGDVERLIAGIRTVDSSSDYPRSLKPRIIADLATGLMSNAQLRENYRANASRFADLVGRFAGRDSLRILGRTDHSVIQLNRVGINWGAAAHEMPKEAIDEYLASVSPTERTHLRTELAKVERLRAIGRDSLVKHARRYGLSVAHIDSTVALMSDLDVVFVNAQLPWKGAVQLTVAGVLDDAIGYLYSPSGEIPVVSNEEYYYLEPIADGWWIFRAG